MNISFLVAATLLQCIWLSNPIYVYTTPLTVCLRLGLRLLYDL